jgi:opacity protein-like surface antigen
MKFDLLTSVSAVALGGLAAALVASPAVAGTFSITETLTVPNVVTELNSGNSTLSFNQFNATPGETLQSVVVSTGGSFKSYGTATNTSAGPDDYSFALGMHLTMHKGAGQTGLILPNLANYASGSQTYPSMPVGVAESFNLSNVALPVSSETLTDPLMTGTLNGFEGAGTFNVYFTTNTGVTIYGGGGSGTTDLHTNASPSVTVTYNYTTTGTPAPEPASLALFGVAMAGLGVVRRRRKA